MNWMEKFKNLSDLEKKIIETSKIEFEKKGYYKASIDEIAKEVQIGKGTIYRHFGTKFKLFVLIIFDIANKFMENINEISNIEDFTEAFLKFIDKVIDTNQKMGKLIYTVCLEESSKEFSKELAGDPETFSIFKTIMVMQESCIVVLREILEKGRKEGKIHPDIQSQIQAEIIFIAVSSFIRMMLSHKNINKKLTLNNIYPFEDGIAEMKNFLFRSIGLNINK